MATLTKLKYLLEDIVLVDDIHNNLLSKNNTELLIKSIYRRIRNATILKENVSQIRLGKDGFLTIYVNPEYPRNPYIFRIKRENQKYIYSQCFTLESFDIFSNKKVLERLECEIQTIIENKENIVYKNLSCDEKTAILQIVNEINKCSEKKITTETITTFETEK